MIARGEVWWADLGEPAGSEPGVRRPVVVVQSDAFNRSRIATIVCVTLTSDLRWAEAPGHVRLTARQTGLPKDSVANVSQARHPRAGGAHRARRGSLCEEARAGARRHRHRPRALTPAPGGCLD